MVLLVLVVHTMDMDFDRKEGSLQVERRTLQAAGSHTALAVAGRHLAVHREVLQLEARVWTPVVALHCVSLAEEAPANC